MAEYYEVVTALNGPEAIKKSLEAKPDVVLLDVMMPGMDGFEVCRQIKSNPITAHIPVVMVTALTDVEDRVKGLESGADDFLSKPVNDISLLARVRSLVRLKMTVDEWRARENTASQLGVVDANESVMNQPADHAQILVLEDMQFDANRITDALGRDQNQITLVNTGMDALKEIAAKDFDLIFVSLNLKREDGIRFCAHLRSNERSRSTPIIMIGQESELDRVAHSLEIGAHDYILRPLDKNEILARCRTQIRRKRFQDKLRANYEISLSMALTDSLTGLYNRRYFEVHMERMLQNAKQQSKPLAFLYMDIDHFKRVNDTYGHNVGDDILKGFAARMKDGLRSFDLIARLGGEEFVAILPDTPAETAYMIAERLRKMIETKPFSVNNDTQELNVTCSFGGVTLSGDHTQSLTVPELIQKADEQLYKAKHDGRNCVYFADKGRL